MNNNSPVPVAKVAASRNLSRIWLVPLVALSIGIWMVYYQWSNQGPLVTIEFEQATGLEAGKTIIKTRDVEVGKVEKVELKEDLSGVVVTARLSRGSEELLTEKTEFWIVSPRISLSGVSGLSTIMSGPYINMAASREGAAQQQFVALPNPPVTPPGTPGLHVTLNSNDEFAFKEGDPIIYKGLKVGEFEDIYFNLEERIVYYNAFVESPYHRLITANTKFWNTSGVKFQLDATGISVEAASVETLLTNGVTFGVPDGMPDGERIEDRAYFDIYPNYQTAVEQRYKLGVEFALLIEDTVRGLNIGAPVEYRGLHIGEVIEINPIQDVDLEILDEAYPIPVIIKLQPGRVGLPDNRFGMQTMRDQTLHWVNRGFRATLKVGNLLTGALYVDLQHYPNMPAEPQVMFDGYSVIPTISGELAQITDKVQELLDKINALPLEQIVGNTNEMLQQIASAASSFQQTGTNLNQLLDKNDYDSLTNQVDKMLKSITRLSKDYSEGSISNAEINKTMQTMQRVMLDLQPLLKQLNNSPSSLVFPPAQIAEPQPKGTRSQP